MTTAAVLDLSSAPDGIVQEHNATINCRRTTPSRSNHLISFSVLHGQEKKNIMGPTRKDDIIPRIEWPQLKDDKKSSALHDRKSPRLAKISDLGTRPYGRSNKVYKNSGIDTFSAPNKECHKYFRGTTFSATMGSVRRVLNCLTAGL
ncbi:hypothetical protein EJB05_47099 [Eragrostis curvula]|uniref:Uncharacterized protein n=1 Tax=Eragrostis curvula TaxID=38414 RepID=A0A5J9T6L9_9POAL|nr:hypothetical protein EJB05_47099 [Eragrostis curvula]